MVRVKFEFNNLKISAKLYDSNTVILNSYRFKKIKDMKAIIRKLRESSDKTYAIHKLSMFRMINEWRAHNLLYKLNLYKNQTKSVDLDTTEPWYRVILYTVLSPFYF